VLVVESRSPHTLSSYPSALVPNSLYLSPGEEGVWDPGESLARGTESGRGSKVDARDDGEKMRNTAPSRKVLPGSEPSAQGGATL
jgi:hypothetical protein